MIISSTRTLTRIASWQVMHLFAADDGGVCQPLLKPTPARALPSPRARDLRAIRPARVHAGADEIESGKIEIILFSVSFIHVTKLMALSFFRRRDLEGAGGDEHAPRVAVADAAVGGGGGEGVAALLCTCRWCGAG